MTATKEQGSLVTKKTACQVEQPASQISACTSEEQQTSCQITVQEKAYYLWEEAGCPESDGVEFWLQAEQSLAN